MEPLSKEVKNEFHLQTTPMPRLNTTPIPSTSNVALQRRTSAGRRSSMISWANMTALRRSVRHYVTGDSPGISEWVDRQSNDLSVVLRFFESVLRTFGALIFVNNVWSGVLFLLACMIHNQFSTLLGLLGIGIAYAVGILMNVPPDRLRNGVATFNGFMVASFVAANAEPFHGVVWNPWLLFPALFFSIISTLIKIALHSVLQHVKLPALNLPFSITTLCFLASQGSTVTPLFPADLFSHPQLANSSTQTYAGSEIARAVFFSISNIYGCDNVTSVCLAWIAVFIASPLLFTMCLLGSCTGTGIAVVLGVAARELATGMWSFNSLLVCGSVGGFFYVWNPFSCALAIFAAAFACVIAGTLYHVLGPVSLPYQALPLFLTDAIFLLALAAYKSRWFVRVEFSEIRYPEHHRRAHLERLKVKNAAAPASSNGNVSNGNHIHVA
ncbi:putative Urea transporter 2 [Hypsibius exemplaris]|uniref:Urea transporter 2 n=1 Tax=Hypsibius exemplaris TaxID=2072580 RepID=A0A1W0X3N4_HYPEX|nr:putative Urea transporter 2 [Hypsibius exemplaris]